MAKIYIETNADGEIIAWAMSRGNDNEIELEVEDTHPFFSANPFYFKLKDGILAEDETTKQKRRKERSDRYEINNLKRLLAETDYYVVRKSEENIEIPDDVKAKRKEARKRLKELGL